VPGFLGVSPNNRLRGFECSDFAHCLVEEQKKAEKSDQYPQHRAEYSEPEWDVPACVGYVIGFCLGHALDFPVSCLPLVVTPECAVCPR
jgi:hypothetical protein